MKNMKTALQLYSVRDYVEKDLASVLKEITEMGYEGVEFAGLYGYEPTDVLKMISETGLTPVCAHVSFVELNNDTSGCLKKYKKIGCRFIALPGVDKNFLPGMPGYGALKADIKKIVAECTKQKIPLLYHNHDYEFVKVDGTYALDILYRDIPELQTEIDTCWVNVAKESPDAYIRKYAGRSPLVHLKDYRNAGKQGDLELCALGAGILDIPAVISAAAEAGTTWLVVEQDEPEKGKTPLECARTSINYLKSIQLGR